MGNAVFSAMLSKYDFVIDVVKMLFGGPVGWAILGLLVVIFVVAAVVNKAGARIPQDADTGTTSNGSVRLDK